MCVCVCVVLTSVLLNYQQDISAYHIYFSILVKFVLGDTHAIWRLREFAANRRSEGRTFLIGVNEITHAYLETVWHFARKERLM